VQYNFAASSKSLFAGNANPACGKTRFYSGSTIGTASGTTESRAKNAAEAEAKAKAQIELDAAKAKNCPNNCKPGQKAAPGEPSINKLGAYRIYQVNPQTWVGYAVAYWTVTITCPEVAPPKKKKKKKKGKNGKDKLRKRRVSKETSRKMC
jgi:hypothetical protein